MRTLLYFECKKIIENRLLWILLICLLIINVYKIYTISENRDREVPGQEKIYDLLSGEITKEKTKFLLEKYNKYKEIIATDAYDKSGGQPDTYTGYIAADFYVFEKIYEEYQYIYEYAGKMEQICRMAENNLQDENIKSDKYQVSRNKKIIGDYRSRGIFSFYNVEDTEIYLNYDFSSMLMFFAVMVGVAGVILQEKKAKMLSILETSMLGNKRVLAVKIMAAFIYVLFIVIFFELCTWLTFSVLFHPEGFLQPLYSIKSYRDTYLNCSIIETIFLGILLKYIALLSFTASVLLLSILSFRPIQTVVGGIIEYFIFIQAFLYSQLWINPIVLLASSQFFRTFEEINFFGHSIYYPFVVTVLVAILIIVLCIMLLLFGKKGLAAKADAKGVC